jgi:hypothetical protein
MLIPRHNFSFGFSLSSIDDVFILSANLHSNASSEWGSQPTISSSSTLTHFEHPSPPPTLIPINHCLFVHVTRKINSSGAAIVRHVRHSTRTARELNNKTLHVTRHSPLIWMLIFGVGDGH